MIELLLPFLLLSGAGIIGTEAVSTGNTNYNVAMRKMAPVIAKQHRKDPAAAERQIRNLSFGDKNWLRRYVHDRMRWENAFGKPAKNLLAVIEKISVHMRNRVRLVGGGAAAFSTVLAAGLLFGFFAAKLLKHTFIMAMYGLGAAVALLASIFIVSYLVRDAGLLSSNFTDSGTVGFFGKLKLVEVLRAKLRGYLASKNPVANPNGPAIATTQAMKSTVDSMGWFERTLAKFFG